MTKQKLIDANALSTHKCIIIGNDGFEFEDEIIYKFDIDDAPIIDAVEVVRCKECCFNISNYKCLNPNSIIAIPKDDDFCSYGKRRGE